MLLRRSELFLIGTLLSAIHALVPVTSNENGIEQVLRKASRNVGGSLYPRATETRDIRSLDGIWNFRLSPSNPLYGYLNGWQEQDLYKTGEVIPMPVPSSYNDIGVKSSIRDHTGVVWYDRRFFVPRGWAQGHRVWLRFSSVHYNAKVFVNSKEVVSHEIGHLPFEVEITDVVSYNSSNLLTVVIDNTLNKYTIPQDTGYDFFNYAGIHRPVYIYSTPQVYIEDIVTQTDVQGYTGIVTYNITYKGASQSDVKCLVEVFDKNETKVGSLQSCTGVIDIANAHLWWPFLMHSDYGYLYLLKVSLIGDDDELLDTYSEKIGIRVISWTNTTVYLNEVPLYLRGFGMHEDSDLRGKGWDAPLWIRNFNLIRWTGANAFRTSHYPYAEEIYQLADEQGVMIIGECPSVNANYYSEELLKKHKQSLTEMIRRDRNHPSVIMWSVANEPAACGSNKNCDYYYSNIVSHVKDLDRSRPVTFALADPHDIIGKFMDVISFNRYNGWYAQTGSLAYITQRVIDEATQWRNKYNKPVLMSEYGADTVAGMHSEPEFVFSEDYQVALMSEHFKAFDKLRQTGFFIGEFIWNFADFATKQGITRVGGNKKGIFTRARAPKASAHHLRARYHALAAADAGAAPPDPDYYVCDNRLTVHDEL